MVGYKYVDNENGVMTNMYSSVVYKIGESYHKEGKIKYHKSGFHFCTYPENTLRYAKTKRPSDFTILEIEANGIIDCGDDDQSNEYYGYYGMYATSDIRINRILAREEIFNMIIESNNPDRLSRYIQLANLNTNEIDYIMNNYLNNYSLIGALYYYQFGFKDGYYIAYKKCHERVLQK